MVKSELVQTLNQKFPDLQQGDVESALNCILGQLTDALVKGVRIEIRDFGSFELRHRPPRIARNPKTGESLQLAAKVNTHFKPGKGMRERVNASRSHFKLKP